MSAAVAGAVPKERRARTGLAGVLLASAASVVAYAAQAMGLSGQRPNNLVVYAVAFTGFALAGWFAYDGWVNWPEQNRRYDEIVARKDESNDKGPDDLAILGSDTDRLRVAMGDLPKEQCRALVLASFYGRTAAEIAESEEIPLGTAKTRIRTAMLRLRAALVDDTKGSE